MKPRIDPEDQPGGYCANCGKEATGRYEDHGPDGAEGFHRENWCIVSACCGDMLNDYPPDEENTPEECPWPERLPRHCAHDWHQQGHINGRPFSVCQSCGAERYDDQ